MTLLIVSDVHNHFTNCALVLLDFATASYHRPTAWTHTCSCKTLYFLLFFKLVWVHCYISLITWVFVCLSWTGSKFTRRQTDTQVVLLFVQCHELHWTDNEPMTSNIFCQSGTPTVVLFTPRQTYCCITLLSNRLHFHSPMRGSQPLSSPMLGVIAREYADQWSINDFNGIATYMLD